MLKIKDDVDLKELEKFGFVQGFDGYSCFDKQKDYLLHMYIDDMRCICFEVISSYMGWVDIPNVIYDLIQAGLVENVGK